MMKKRRSELLEVENEPKKKKQEGVKKHRNDEKTKCGRNCTWDAQRFCVPTMHEVLHIKMRKKLKNNKKPPKEKQ